MGFDKGFCICQFCLLKLSNHLTKEEMMVLSLILIILVTGSLVEYFRL